VCFCVANGVRQHFNVDNYMPICLRFVFLYDGIREYCNLATVCCDMSYDLIILYVTLLFMTLASALRPIGLIKTKARRRLHRPTVSPIYLPKFLQSYMQIKKLNFVNFKDFKVFTNFTN